jgi:hypothetical protein
VAVEGFPRAIPDAGSTGTAADSIQVTIESESTGLQKALTFTEYNLTAELPTSLELPCSGSGRVNFIPEPVGTGARTASVPVEFLGELPLQ